MNLKSLFEPNQCVYIYTYYASKQESVITVGCVKKVGREYVYLNNGDRYKKPVNKIPFIDYLDSVDSVRGQQKLFLNEAEIQLYEEHKRLFKLIYDRFYIHNNENCGFSLEQLQEVAKTLKLN